MPWQYMPSGSPLRAILMAEMPDIIEVTDKYTLSMLGAMIRKNKFRQLNRPMLVHFSCERMDDNIASFMTKKPYGRWLARRVIGNYILPTFDFHIANSPYTAEEFFQSVKKANNPRRSEWFFNWCWRFFNAPLVPFEERIAACPRGVDGEHFSSDRNSAEVKREMRRRANIPENSIILLYAGRISPEKNIGLLPDLMEILAKDTSVDYRLLVAGAGPQAEWLTEETNKRIPNKIIQLGHLEKEKLADYYANCDVFVHPNPREPFGIAPLEAMASGVPVLAPNAGGLLSYATNENSWLIVPTAQNFANAVREIIENPELRARRVKNAFEAVRSNTREISTDNLIATYERLYDDFQKRRELFTNLTNTDDFNFAKFVNDKI